MKRTLKYADDNQANLYKKFSSTHYLGNSVNVYNPLQRYMALEKHQLPITYTNLQIYVIKRDGFNEIITLK